MIVLSRHIEPLSISSPTYFKTGKLSPVRELSSKDAEPSLMIPSMTIFSPAFISMISPTTTFSNGTKLFWLFLITTTSVGIVLVSKSSVSTACFLPKTSKYFPTKTKVIIITTESK